MSAIRELTKGFFKENPIFVIMLGLCPLLATSVSLSNGIGMGIAATFVLVGSNAIVALVRNLIPSEVRIPCYIVIIATFVTIVELVMQGFAPALFKSLGIFVPLIVVNCIILGRAEAFASKNSAWKSILDGIGMGIGFTLSLLLLAAIREVLGNGTVFGYPLAKGLNPLAVMVQAPGALLTIGLLMGFFNWRRARKQRAANRAALQQETDASSSKR